MRESITLLHVSDMQFGRNHRFGNLGGSEADVKFDTLFQRLSDDLALLQEKEGVKPELIVVSGDLAEWAKKKEFADALKFLVRLSERLKLPRRRVVIVPGNHDINRKLCEAYFAECAAEDRKPLAPYSPKWRFYEWLFKEFYRNEKDITFTIEEPWTYWELADLNLAVAGVNSTMAESHRDSDHYGWVGESQLQWFAGRLRQAKKYGWFRLGVVHHNVLRGAQDDDENLRDADDLERHLAPWLNLLLHGHTHNGKIGWLRSNLAVLSTGSAALKAEARPAEVPNQYQAIRLWPGRIELWTRLYDPEQKRWIGDTRCSQEGNDWRIQHSVVFESVSGTFPGASQATPRRTGDRADQFEVERMWRDVQEPRDDFLSRVADICRLRYRGAQVDDFRSDNSRPKYLRVQQADGTMMRVFPIGISEIGISEEILQNFRQQVFAQYRALDPNLPCEVVYGGKHASDESIRKAGADGIRLSSFIEFQGIIDFRGYVERQTRKLEADTIYPPHVYVPQKLVYEVGREQRVSGDACATVLDWLREPLARFVLVLGDFGTGKTFLLHEVARRIPTEIPHLVPMLIELRALEKSRTLLELVAQHLAASNETLIDLEVFPYMLREGRIALLFDGFDELAQRVTYDRAAEHFETLLQAAGGQARVVLTSRTQHFESDQQVKTALLARADVTLGTHLARVQPFDEAQILLFLENLLGRPEDARKRFDLIHDVHDLLGLSHNPRMLGFIANLPEEQLRGAQERTGKITSAELYRLLIERWLTFEYERVQPRGAGPTLTVEERRRAATAVALCLWPKIERTIRLSELAEEVARAVDKLTERQLDERTAAHLVGSGTLLVRDQAGVFAFVHQSVMEWLVADEAARALKTGKHPDVLALNKMTPLMADFFCDLAGHEIACNWAIDITTSPESAASAVLGASQAKTNALLVLDRLGVKYKEANLTGQDLRGRDFSGQNFAGANLVRVDLTEARLVGANLRGADLSEAVLERADLSRANLGGAKLVGVNARGAKLLGADVREADLAGANLRRAKLAGAQFTQSALAGTDTFGAVLPGDWQRRSGLPRPDPKPMTSSASPCSSLAFGPDGIMAVAQQNGTIRLWDLATDQEVCVLRGHEESVRSVAFSPDGKLLASGGSDKTVRLWEAGSGKEVATLRGHEESVRSVAFSPDGKLLASGGSDKTVRLWEAGSGKEVATLRGHEESVMSVAFSPDGKLLASGGSDKTVRLWEAGSGKEVATLRGHEESVRSVAFSPDGKLLASGGDDKTVRLWEAGSGKEVAILRGHEESVRSVAFSPDRKLLASGGFDNTVRLWEAGSGKEVATLRGHENWVMSVEFSPDGKRLASAGFDNTVRLWEAGSGKEVATLRGHENWVMSVEFSPDGKLLASGGSDNTVRLWEAGSGKEVATLRGHENWVMSVAFSPDGKLLASGGSDKTVRLWEAGSGKEVATLRGHENIVMSVAFSPDGKLLASGGSDKTVRLWEAGSGKEVATLRGHEESVMSVAFSPDRKRLASGGSDKTVRLWEAGSGKEVATLRGHEESVMSVAFSPDGKLLASGGSDKTVRLWEAGSGKEVATLRGHENWVMSVAFSPDGKLLASGGDDRTVRLWEAKSGKEVATLRGHENIVMSVAFSPDGKLLASGGDDNTLCLWELATNSLLATIVPTAQGWAAFTPDGRYKAVGNLGGAFWYAIGLCRFEPGELDEFLPPGTLRCLEPDEPLC